MFRSVRWAPLGKHLPGRPLRANWLKVSGMDEMPKLEGRCLGGRYRLERLIDSGGFGAVYAGVDEKFGSEIAVKVASRGVLVAAFRKEALLARRFKHENVVQVHDYGVEHDGLCYIVMDLLAGTRLDQLIGKSGARMPLEIICQFVEEIGSALIHAHEKGLVHRDLKPKNVVYVKNHNGVRGNKFVLLDFGIATQIDATNSLRNATMDGAGTPEYMSPEQVTSHLATAQSDIYSFGVILYQLLTGAVPFPLKDESHLAVALCLTHIAKDPPRALSDAAPERDISPAVEEIVLQCLEKAPERRPASIEEVQRRFLGAFTGNGSQSAASATAVEPAATLLPDTLSLRRDRTVTGSASAPVSPPEISQLDRCRRRVPFGHFFAAVGGMGAICCLGVLLLLSVIQPTDTPEPLTSPDAETAAPKPRRAEIRFSADPAELVVCAGDSAVFRIIAHESEVTEPIEYEIRASSEALDIKELAATADGAAAEHRVKVSLTAAAGMEEIAIRARAGDQERTLRLPLEIRPPENLWLPHGLSGAGELRQVGDQLYYSELRPDAPGKSAARFLLVQEPDRAPFYVMENKVWNELFGLFADEQLGYRDPRRQSGHGDWSPELGRAPGKRMLPATNITVLEAVRFARWLAGEMGDLPTEDEWDAAAGYYRWKDGPAETRSGPFTNPKDAAVGRPAPLPVDRSECDVSIYGCRDMAGNGYEWTRTISAADPIRPETPLESVLPRLDAQAALVTCRGRSFDATGPLFFSELEAEKFDTPRQFELSGANSRIGFRVVIRPSRRSPSPVRPADL